MIKTTVWDLQANLPRRLLWWSGLSVTIGLLMIVLGRGFWRAFGIQAFAWGGIDGAVALLGHRAYIRRRASLADPMLPTHLRREARNLRRLLWINTGLDVIYVIGGATLALTLGASDAAWRGHGWGIVVQGAFLLIFDLTHALRVPADAMHDFAAAAQKPER